MRTSKLSGIRLQYRCADVPRGYMKAQLRNSGVYGEPQNVMFSIVTPLFSK